MSLWRPSTGEEGQETEPNQALTESSPPQSSSRQHVDESWPMQTLEAFQKSKTNQLQKEAYSTFMSGCRQAFGKEACDKHEQDRLALNTVQPPLMRNFTTAGYAKVAMPDETFEILQEYIEEFQDNLYNEEWGQQTYTNHWKTNTDFHNIEIFMPLRHRQTITRQVQDVLEKWVGVPLTPTSMYGVRVYRKGAILAPHVDRLPLVVSAILNVVQEEEATDWPLQVIGHNGQAVNLTLQPGEMILYESHSIIHGRPYPLQKWYYANVFLHFEPLGYSYELRQDLQKNGVANEQQSQQEWARAMFDQALNKQQPITRRSHLAAGDEMPLYVTPRSEQELRWKQQFIFQREPKKPRKPQMTSGATNAHTVAASGDLDALKREIEKDPSVIDKADVNGWKPLHEAARGGQTKVLEYLLEKGVDVNERTHKGKGASALWWAERNFPEHHPAIALLRRHGARALPPRDD